MLIALKSLYAKVCVVLVSAIWTLYVGQSAIAVVLVFVPGTWRVALSVLLAVLLLVVTVKTIWSWLAHFAVESVINSTKVTVAILLLTLALFAFPGSFLIPLAYAAISGREGAALYAWFVVIGLPVFVVLSIAGLVLVYQSRLGRLDRGA